MKIKISFQCLFVMWMAVVVEYMDSSLVHNIFMLCAMWLVGRLCTGGSNSQNGNHTFMGGGMVGGWVMRPMDFPCTRKGQRVPVKLAGQPLPVLTWGQQTEDGGESTD